MLSRMKHQQGFTLTELLIVVALIAILGVVALPAYNDQIQKARRNVGKNELLDLAARQERFYSENGYYGSILNITGSATHTTENGNYAVTVACFDNAGNAAACGSAAARPQAYTLTAAPSAAMNDTYCGNFTITQASQRGISGAAAHLDACWN